MNNKQILAISVVSAFVFLLALSFGNNKDYQPPERVLVNVTNGTNADEPLTIIQTSGGDMNNVTGFVLRMDSEATTANVLYIDSEAPGPSMDITRKCRNGTEVCDMIDTPYGPRPDVVLRVK